MACYGPANLHSPTYRVVHAVVGDCLHIINRRPTMNCKMRASNHLMLFMKHLAGGQGMSLALSLNVVET